MPAAVKDSRSDDQLRAALQHYLFIVGCTCDAQGVLDMLRDEEVSLWALTTGLTALDKLNLPAGVHAALKRMCPSPCKGIPTATESAESASSKAPDPMPNNTKAKQRATRGFRKLMHAYFKTTRYKNESGAMVPLYDPDAVDAKANIKWSTLMRLPVFEGAIAEWRQHTDFGRLLSVDDMKRMVSNFCQNNRNKTRMKQRVADRQQKQAAAEAAKEAADATALQRTARRMGRAPVTTCSGTETDETSNSDEDGQD